ncbi:Atrophin-1 multi-domain protein [Actimicrobium antarcticum]|uniref:Atrophin-1 multi-domain protein n=1 Tax=Actimicrobium antarcticum TaxID=1051899 RepID=A0ABP7T4Q9_9BURK
MGGLVPSAISTAKAAAVSTKTLVAASTFAPQWESYLTPFNAASLWNARPVEPVFGDFVIPKSSYFPSIASGVWSTGMFLAAAGDGPMAVKGIAGKPGVWDPDAEANRPQITIPRWPADTVGAGAADGHADIYDPVLRVIHSFWQLKKIDGQWVAAQYAWAPIEGRGWGDPAHYFQGSRAAGVPTSAGLMRKHEINDGEPVYHHALAMSLTFNALAATPNYIYPATSADNVVSTPNTGMIPEGALMMLPPSYDTSKIASLPLRKVAETLKLHGAYVVDRNYGTPFAIYVENGADFKMSAMSGWDNAVASELDRMRAGLRQVTSATSWLDGNNQVMVPEKVFNRLSMRGPWQAQTGPLLGTFDTLAQAVVFPSTATRVTQVNYSGRGLNKIGWSVPQVGSIQRLTASAKGGAKLRMVVQDKSGTKLFDSGELGAGESAQFPWPGSDARFVIYAISGVDQPSLVRGDLVDGGT